MNIIHPRQSESKATLYFPSTFDLTSIPYAIRDRVIYFIHLLNIGRYGKRSRYGWVNKTGSKWRTLIGRTQFQKVKQCAIDLELVECDERYSNGPKKMVKQYRLGGKWWGKHIEWSKVDISHRYVCQTITAKYDTLKTNAHTEVEKWIEHSIQQLTIDIPEETKNGLSPHLLIMPDMLSNRRFLFKRDTFGRIHNNLTSMPKTLRKFCKIAQSPMECVDIPNSHCLFLLKLFLSLQPLTTLSKYSYVVTLLESGRFWKYIQDISGLPDLDQKTLKHKVFYPMIYGKVPTKVDKRRNENILPLWIWFQHTFPEIAQFIVDSKSKGQLMIEGKSKALDHSHKVLPRTLQRIEAEFVIDKVCARLHNEYGLLIVPIHDCVVCEQGNGAIVKRVMLEEFIKIDLKPELEIRQC